MYLSKVLKSLFLFLTIGISTILAQDDVTIIAPTSEAAEGLDLTAVSELFKDTESLEEFEKQLNDPETEINNLDLDDNGEVDYIRIVEDVVDDTHIIILQVPLGEDEFQDVATIEVEKNGEEDYNLQVRGNEEIYGPDYYIAPAHVHIHAWPIIPWIYRPVYRPYRSTFYFGFYPRWWRPYRPVTVNVYRTRTVRYTSRRTFTVRRTSVVRTSTKVNYKPRSSTRVKKKTTVSVSNQGGKKSITHKTKRTNASGKTTTTKRTVTKKKNPKTGKSTVTRSKRKTTKTKGGKKTTKVKRTRKKD
ncbi:MAG: hypothetical protein DWQ05_20665 [Calditrichaeota bacterium]|nr:MAG: hypothetical protein DWQ05_20665 [Calditrichota bacterium]